jgi:hypothetical protein
MQFECAHFILVVFGMACAIIAARSSLSGRVIKATRAAINLQLEAMKKAKPMRYSVRG